MYSSTGLVNQIILDALADWAVQAGRNQINQIFVKYPGFSSNKFIFLTLKPQIKKKRNLITRVRTTILIIMRLIPSIFRNEKVYFSGLK